MTKKAIHEKKKKKRYDLLSEMFKLIVFIVKLPYFLIKGIFFLFDKSKQKKKIAKKKKVREMMPHSFSEFEVLETESGNFKKWFRNILKSESKIGIILGARGTGKTALGMRFLENIYSKTNVKCYAMGFKEEELPSWIDVVEDIEEIKNDSLVLIDEGGILFSSRKSMSAPNKILSDLILVARHKNISILFISQNSSNLDINILRQADYLALKPSSLLQKDFERKKIKEIYDEIKEGFVRYSEIKGICYIYSDMYRGFIKNDLPSFWTMNISKSFK